MSSCMATAAEEGTSNKTSEAWKEEEEEEKERTKIIRHNTSNLHKHNNNDDADAHVRTTTRSIMQKSMGRQSLHHTKPG